MTGDLAKPTDIHKQDPTLQKWWLLTSIKSHMLPRWEAATFRRILLEYYWHWDQWHLKAGWKAFMAVLRSCESNGCRALPVKYLSRLSRSPTCGQFGVCFSVCEFHIADLFYYTSDWQPICRRSNHSPPSRRRLLQIRERGSQQLPARSLRQQPAVTFALVGHWDVVLCITLNILDGGSETDIDEHKWPSNLNQLA